MQKDFYVYVYLRDDGSPWYVGKGKGKRAFNWHKRFGTISEDHIRISATKMYEWDAFQLEMFLIFLYGRKNNGTGILANLSDGGEGATGRVSTPEYRQLVSKQQKGRMVSLEEVLLRSMTRSGKSYTYGTTNGRSKLTEQQVRVIRTGGLTEKQATQLYGISRTQFYRLKRGEQWPSLSGWIRVWPKC